MMKLSKGLPNWHYTTLRFLSIGKKTRQGSVINIGLRHTLLWITGFVVFVGLMFGFDLIGMALEALLTVIFEFAQENLENFYLKTFKLDLYHAQMATAYTGFIVIMGIGLFLFRRFATTYKEMRESLILERDKVKDKCFRSWVYVRSCWDELDKFNKFSALIALVVFAVPVVSILCFALGKVIAEIV